MKKGIQDNAFWRKYHCWWHESVKLELLFEKREIFRRTVKSFWDQRA